MLHHTLYIVVSNIIYLFELDNPPDLESDFKSFVIISEPVRLQRRRYKGKLKLLPVETHQW